MGGVSSVLRVAIMAALAATVLILVMGIVVMARGGPVNDRYGNVLMRLRIVLQGVAVALVAALWALSYG